MLGICRSGALIARKCLGRLPAHVEQVSKVVACLFTSFGSGLSGKGGLTPDLTGSGGPNLAGNIAFHTTNGVGGATGFLFYRPEALAPIPAFGGLLYTLPPLPMIPSTLSGSPGTGGAGSTSQPANLSDAASLLGVTLVIQAGFLDAGAIQGVSLTNGVRMTIGE